MTLLQTPAEARNSRVLGKAVHPAALRRLHELFPDARVRVQHESHLRELPAGSQRMSRRCYPNPERETYVYIDVDGEQRPGGTLFALATCHPEDNFNRRKGIEIAFRRALTTARYWHERRRIAESYKRNGATSG